MDQSIIDKLKEYDLDMADMDFIRNCVTPEGAILNACGRRLKEVATRINRPAWDAYEEVETAISATYDRDVEPILAERNRGETDVTYRRLAGDLDYHQAEQLLDDLAAKYYEALGPISDWFDAAWRDARLTLLRRLLEAMS